MTLARFIVTHVDQAKRYGYVRQLDADGAQPINEPIRFGLTDMAEIIMHSPGEGEPPAIAYSIPSTATRRRMATIDTVLVGSVACIAEDTLARDDDNYLFLRNWGFADQLDALVRA